MGNYRVSVYAICKNETKFVERWVESMREADAIYVLDTGSTDDTVDKLRALGVNVTVELIRPWRFDTARNRSLALVPEDTDICVCTDLDEVFHPGWRECVERAWAQGADQLHYRYTWNFNADGSEGYVFWIDKIHARHGFSWVNPVHEVLRREAGPANAIYAEGVQLDHHADDTKSRGQYLPLLELAVRENPDNDRNMHYLGREYLFHKDWYSCIQTLKRHLAMPQATWKDERAASMRYLAQAYEALGQPKEAEVWLQRATAEAPYLREPWLSLATFYYKKENWQGVLDATEHALAITERPRTYITEAQSFGSLPYDLASLACYYLGFYEKALAYIEEAIRLSPQDTRLKQNKQFFEAAARQ